MVFCVLLLLGPFTQFVKLVLKFQVEYYIVHTEKSPRSTPLKMQRCTTSRGRQTSSKHELPSGRHSRPWPVFWPCVSVENLTSSTECDIAHVSCSVGAQNVLHFWNEVLTIPSSNTPKQNRQQFWVLAFVFVWMWSFFFFFVHWFVGWGFLVGWAFLRWGRVSCFCGGLLFLLLLIFSNKTCQKENLLTT